MLTLPDEDSGPSRPKSSKKKPKDKAPPPQFDRSGEMPDEAQSDPSKVEKATPAPTASGLAAVDLLSDSGSGTRPTSRFEEYKVDDEDSRQHATEAADVPIQGEIEVVKVKRKKKKDGSKKKT